MTQTDVRQTIRELDDLTRRLKRRGELSGGGADELLDRLCRLSTDLERSLAERRSRRRAWVC